MANKRDNTSQKRARENRARRQALEARTKGAPTRPSRVAPSTAEKLAKASSTKGSSSKDDPKGATTSGKPRRERPPKPGDKPVDLATLEGSWFKKVTQVPGGLQVLMAAALTVFITGMASFTDLYIAAEDVDKKGAKATQTIFEANGTGKALLLLGIPLAVVGVALGFTLTKHRRRIWLGAAVIIGAIFGTSLILYLFVAGTLGWAVFRAAKVEGPNEPLFRFRRGPKDASADAEADAEADADGPEDDDVADAELTDEYDDEYDDDADDGDALDPDDEPVDEGESDGEDDGGADEGGDARGSARP